jgi:hypothetical protein
MDMLYYDCIIQYYIDDHIINNLTDTTYLYVTTLLYADILYNLLIIYAFKDMEQLLIKCLKCFTG